MPAQVPAPGSAAVTLLIEREKEEKVRATKIKRNERDRAARAATSNDPTADQARRDAAAAKRRKTRENGRGKKRR